MTFSCVNCSSGLATAATRSAKLSIWRMELSTIASNVPWTSEATNSGKSSSSLNAPARRPIASVAVSLRGLGSPLARASRFGGVSGCAISRPNASRSRPRARAPRPSAVRRRAAAAAWASGSSRHGRSCSALCASGRGLLPAITTLIVPSPQRTRSVTAMTFGLPACANV